MMFCFIVTIIILQLLFRYDVLLYFYHYNLSLFCFIDVESEVEGNDSDDEIPMEGEGPSRRKHRRKQLTYQRLVNSIDSALDETNYDTLETSNRNITLTSHVPDERDKKKKKELKFVDVKPATVGRQRSSDVIRQKPGISRYSTKVSSQKEAFSLFITDEMMSTLIKRSKEHLTNALNC